MAEIEIACLSNDAYPTRVRQMFGAIQRAEQLRWLHTCSAGVDSPAFQALLRRGVRLTNSTGTAAASIAHTVAMYLLALSRDLPRWTRHQQQRTWDNRPFAELIGQRLLVLGWGPIGQHTARLATALGMEVEIARRRASGDEPHPVHRLSALGDALGRADWVVLALPLTSDTRHLIGPAEFAALRPGARLINVGRGDLVDEPALIEALRSGRLAGAALDVFATEPLPPDSPLWAMEQVIITPHGAGQTDHTEQAAQELFVENLARYVAGTPLLHEVASAAD